MKPLRIEVCVLSDDKERTGAIDVYNTYSEGKPIYQKTIICNNDLTEVIAYILKKYVINKNLNWNKVTYKKDEGMMILYGEDKRG